jgi:glycosyltransferase involved in cell wall biosynthesis
MSRVLLLHGGTIPHYRVPIYNYLTAYLKRQRFELVVGSEGVQPNSPHQVQFRLFEMPLSTLSVARLVYREQIDVVIMFVDMRHLYLFPTYAIAKGLLRRKMVWWGQGRDLLAVKKVRIKNLAYSTEHLLCDSIILYAEHLRKYVSARFQAKVFIANNTLCMESPSPISQERKRAILAEHQITTRKNIICVGRLQRRKRLEKLIMAVRQLNRADVGVILVGPDADGVMGELQGRNVYSIGSLYGQDKIDLLLAADIYCLPGAVGLSIVDAFHCGLPFVTEEGDESAEIMYLRDGINGFIVPRDNVEALAQRLSLLLDDEELRSRFSKAALREVSGNAHIDRLCEGFAEALQHAVRN